MNLLLRPIARVGALFFLMLESLASFLRHFARIFTLIRDIVTRSPLIYKNIGLSIEQMYRIGITSLPLVSVIALFVGSITVTQAIYQFSGFVPLRYLGLAVCKTLVTELAPVIIAMVVSGRISTAIAAEIGSMKTTEQLDAMTVLSLDPVRYLIIPKTIACVLMLPVLVIYAELLAFLSSIVTALLTVKITSYAYLSGLRLYFNPNDLYVGVAKTAVFGAIIAVVGSYFGFETRGGAEGVGNSTTRAVMLASVLILIFDFIAFCVLR